MPNLPFVIADAAPSPERVGADTFGGDKGLGVLGQSLQNAGSVIAEANDRLFHAEQSAKARLALSKASIALAEEQAALEEAGDHEGAEALFGKAIEKQRAGGAQLRGPYAEQFGVQFDEMASRESLRVRGWVRGKTLDSANAATLEATDNWVARFADTGDVNFLAQANAGLDANEAMTETQKQAAKQAALVSAARGRGAKLIQADPEFAEKAFKSDPLFSMIPEEQRFGLIEAAQSEASERQRVELQQMAYADAVERQAAVAQDNANFLQVLNRAEPMSPQEIRDLPWKDATQQATAMNWSASRIAAAAGQKSDATVWAEYARLARLKVENPEQFVTEPLNLGLLSDKHKEFWIKEQVATGRGEGGSGVFTFRDRSNQAWMDIKAEGDIGVIWDSDLDDTHRGLFDSIVEDEFADFKTAHAGKDPSRPEFNKILNEASVRFNQEVQAGNVLALPLAADAAVRVPPAPVSIPISEQRLIIEALMARGIPREKITLQMLVDQYEATP